MKIEDHHYITICDHRHHFHFRRRNFWFHQTVQRESRIGEGSPDESHGAGPDVRPRQGQGDDAVMSWRSQAARSETRGCSLTFSHFKMLDASDAIPMVLFKSVVVVIVIIIIVVVVVVIVIVIISIVVIIF